MESKQDPLAALIGGLIGGQQQSSPSDLGGLLQALLGGQGLGALAGLLGGGAQTAVANSLSQQTGLSPTIAQVVVEFLIRKLLGGESTPAASTTTKPKPRPTKPRPSSTSKPKPSATKPRPSSSKPKPVQPTGGSPDLGGLIGSLIGGQTSTTPTSQQPSGGIDLGSLLTALSGSASGERYLHSSGLAQELAQETGLDEQTAAHSLQQAMALLAQRGQTGAMDEAAPAPARPRRRRAKT